MDRNPGSDAGGCDSDSSCPGPGGRRVDGVGRGQPDQCLPEIGQIFEKQHPGVKVIFNFAASGPLLQQIAQGAPVDGFASADQKTMNQAQDQKLVVPASRKNFVINSLVLIVPQDSKLALSGPK